MLLVHSKSTERYADDWDYDKKMLVSEPPTLKTLLLEKEDGVIAIGGGSVIDTAKIISNNPIIAIPTTYSGASRTSHAVYWDKGRKYNLNTEKPVTIVEPRYFRSLPKDIENYSLADCTCHILESLTSKKATPISKFYAQVAFNLLAKGNWGSASLLAGDAIEITGTNILHALSYALTVRYNIPHAKGLTFLLARLSSLYGWEVPPLVDLSIDTEWVVEEAFTYPKAFDSTLPITKEELRRLLG